MDPASWVILGLIAGGVATLVYDILQVIGCC
jgi:hypothetical protein